jgi:hypothetical protein
MTLETANACGLLGATATSHAVAAKFTFKQIAE